MRCQRRPKGGTAAPEPATAGGEVTAQLPAVVVQADGTGWTVQRVWPGKESGTLTVEVRGQEGLRAGLWRRQGLELFPAGQDRDNPPAQTKTEPYKTHLAYVRERRNPEDGEAILAEALAKLRASK